MRWAACVTLCSWLCVAGECPKSVEVPIVLDGVGYEIVFEADKSLLGRSLAVVAAEGLTGERFNMMTAGCDGDDLLCIADMLAKVARARLRAAGCGSAALLGASRGVFDVLQVGARRACTTAGHRPHSGWLAALRAPHVPRLRTFRGCGGSRGARRS